MKRKAVKWAWGVVFVVLAVAATIAARRDEDGPAVDRYRVGYLDVGVVLTEHGVLESREAFPVELGASGEIAFMAPAGEPVQGGAPVLRVDDSKLKTRYDEIELNVKLSEIERDVSIAVREKTLVEERNRLLTTSNRLVLARMRLVALERGLTPGERRELAIEHELLDLDVQDAREALERQQRLYEKAFISKAVLEKQERALAKVEAELVEKELQANLKLTAVKPEEVLEVRREIQRLEGELTRGERAMARKLARVEALITERTLAVQREEFELAGVLLDMTNCVVYATTGGVMRARMFWDWRSGGLWQEYKPGLSRRKHDRVADIINPGLMDVRVMVHEADVERIAVGQPARVVLPAFPGREFTGRLEYVGGIGRDRHEVAPRGHEGADSGVIMFGAQVSIDGEHGAFRPGMSALLDIEIEPPRRRLVVPLECVGRDDEGVVVRLADDDRMRRILGERLDEQYFEVTEGLAEGELIERPFLKGGPS